MRAGNDHGKAFRRGLSAGHEDEGAYRLFKEYKTLYIQQPPAVLCNADVTRDMRSTSALCVCDPDSVKSGEMHLTALHVVVNVTFNSVRSQPPGCQFMARVQFISH